MQSNAKINSSAPDFTLSSTQGDEISLANYRGERHVVLWFSRGFQCQFCRGHMERITEKTVYGSWVDVMNRNFIQRLHHHALTAVEQGLFIINKEGLIRYQMQTGPLDPIPSGEELLEIALAVNE
jgi:peroxiredoxin